MFYIDTKTNMRRIFMKSVNKILSLVLCLTMVLGVFAVVPFSAGAAEADVAETGESSGTTGDCTWTLDDNGVLTISGNGAMADYVGMYDKILPIPWGRSITKVIIEDGVTIIGACAFYDCTGLTSVDIPDSVTRIGMFAFLGCTGLTNVDIPDSVTSIGTDAFYDCAGLTSVTIGKSVISIVDYDGPESCHPFERCPNLTSIKVSEDNPVYDSRNDCNGIIETETNTLICGCKNTKIPDSVTSIIGAFYDCSGLTSITIPNSVTSIGFISFIGCRDLTNIVIPDSVTSIDGSEIPSTTHICCSPGSAAETYAKKYGNSYGHDYVLTPIDAENHQGVCSYCGDKTEPEAHTFTDGVCTSCGYKEPLIELVDGYYYIDGLLAKGKGAVEYAGDIYFVRSDGSVFTSGKLYVTEAKANGILTAGTYYFDAEGKLINSGVVDGYYFENRKIAKGAGIIEFENNIYYIRNDGSAAVSTKIGIPEAKTNGLISSGYYSFDEAGRLISDGIVDGYYYKDCVIVKSAGIVQFEGDLYYIRNDGSVFTSGRLYVTEPKTNGLIEAGTYRFDGDGKLIK